MSLLSKISIPPDEIISFLKCELKFNEVYNKVLYQKVINRSAQAKGITVTPEEIQAEANRQRYEKRLEKAADTVAWLEEQMITSDDWEVGIRDRLAAGKLAKCLFAKEVEKVFAQNRINFDRVLLYQIIVPYQKLAQELFYEIDEEEISFYQAAHLYDLDERRRHQCGYEGKVYRWSLKPDMAALVFNAQPREVIGPIKTEHGYHLLMVEEFIPAELTPEIYQDMLDKMFKDWLNSELNYMLHSQTVQQN